jgi:folate-binding protein YgfZ
MRCSKVWSQLDVHAAPVGAPVWTLLDILAGVPEIRPETVEEFIPQTVNLDLLGGISFDKGCYTGQEIVARLHYRGTVKRRMVLAACDSARAAAPGHARSIRPRAATRRSARSSWPRPRRSADPCCSCLPWSSMHGPARCTSAAVDGPPLTLR